MGYECFDCGPDEPRPKNLITDSKVLSPYRLRFNSKYDHYEYLSADGSEWRYAWDDSITNVSQIPEMFMKKGYRSAIGDVQQSMNSFRGRGYKF